MKAGISLIPFFPADFARLYTQLHKFCSWGLIYFFFFSYSIKIYEALSDLQILFAKILALHFRTIMLHGNIFHYFKRSGIKEKLATDSVFSELQYKKDKTQESEITTKKITIEDEAGKIHNERSLSPEQIA